MERAVPVRSSHTSTAGMLAWPHPDGAGPPPGRRPNQPTEEFRKVVFGNHDTGGEAAEGRSKTRAGSAPEMTGSGIFKAERAAPTVFRDRQICCVNPWGGIRLCPMCGNAVHLRCMALEVELWNTASQITFAEDGSVPPRNPTSVAEVTRQRELSCTVQSEGDGTTKRQVSDTKSKELCGHDIFADHEDPRPNRSRRSDYCSSAAHSPVKNANVSTFSFGEANVDSKLKTAKKIASNKSTGLTGDDIAKGDSAPASVEKQPLCGAKLKAMAGSDGIGDGKAPTTREHAGRRSRQPPGGDSSISLA